MLHVDVSLPFLRSWGMKSGYLASKHWMGRATFIFGGCSRPSDPSQSFQNFPHQVALLPGQLSQLCRFKQSGLVAEDTASTTS